METQAMHIANTLELKTEHLPACACSLPQISNYSKLISRLHNYKHNSVLWHKS